MTPVPHWAAIIRKDDCFTNIFYSYLTGNHLFQLLLIADFSQQTVTKRLHILTTLFFPLIVKRAGKKSTSLNLNGLYLISLNRKGDFMVGHI